MKDKKDHKYDDIINLPHHVSATHPPMSVQDRAAQFAPFAALTGHDEAIRETSRLTEERMELDESRKSILNGKLQMLKERIKEKPETTITYFVPDDRKSGGSYVTATGSLKKIDEYEHVILLSDGTAIPIEDITEVEIESSID